MIRTLGFAVTLALLSVATAKAQHHSDYASFAQRDIKSLSQQQIDDLRAGAGMGLSLAAELNGAPGPSHVLDLSGKLGLSTDQIARISNIKDEMKASAIGLGSAIVELERNLDSAFRVGFVDEEKIASLTNALGALNADLRLTHLEAHLKTRRILTESQVATYTEARGYGLNSVNPLHRPH